MPSSLPEVTPASAQDPLLHLKQQLNIPPPSQSPSTDARAKSNDLLSLLRGGSAAEMRNGPVTPMEQTTLPIQPRSPMRPPPESHLHDTINMQSPPPSFDLYPQSHPTAPPSSALPQLSQHTRSLLDTFSKPSVPPSPSTAAAQQLPTSKQNLLAAFTSQSKPTPQPTPQPTTTLADNAANGLLAMLQRKKDPAHTPEMSVSSRVEVQPQRTASPATTSLPAPAQQQGRPAALSPFDPVGLVQRQTSVSPAPAAQSAPALARTKPPPQPIEILSPKQPLRADQPPTQTPSSPTALSQQYTVQSPPSAAQVQRSWASIATNSKQPLHTTKVEPTKKVQPEPAELSATSEHVRHPPPADKTKAGLLSLLGSTPSKAPKSGEPKSRSGTTAANLDRPFDEPDFDAVARATSFDEMKREPVTSDRKLFDHKQGEAKQSPVAHRVMSRYDDRNRLPKSPRTARQKQSNTSRPVTPKEVQKPFQPQILKRPQTFEGEPSLGLPSLLAQSSATQGQLATPSTMSPLTVPVDAPRSPDVDMPHAVTAAEITRFFSPTTRSPIPQDPSRAALLDLLRPPTQQPSKADPDSTPKQSAAGFTLAHQPSEGIVSPPSASQLVSPVLDDHYDVHAPRSRVSSLASTAASNVGARPYPEKRQTAAGDKAFLMSYLKNFAGAGQEA